MPRYRDDDEDDRPRRSRRRDEDDDPPPRKSGGGKTLAIVLGIVGVVALLVIAGVVTVVMMAVGKVRQAADRMQAQQLRTTVHDNAKELAFGSHSYADTYDRMPGPVMDSSAARGKITPPANPSDRLSWRVELLPYIEQDNLYRAADPSQPWNSPANAALANARVRTFADPLDPSDGSTRFRCFYDNGAVFETNPIKRPRLYSIPDGTSNTILFVEAADRVPWPQFNEFRFDPNGGPPALGHPQREVFAAAMCDGSVRWVRKSVSPTTLKHAIGHSDGMVLGPDFDQ